MKGHYFVVYDYFTTLYKLFASLAMGCISFSFMGISYFMTHFQHTIATNNIVKERTRYIFTCFRRSLGQNFFFIIFIVVQNFLSFFIFSKKFHRLIKSLQFFGCSWQEKFENVRILLKFKKKIEQQTKISYFVELKKIILKK